MSTLTLQTTDRDLASLNGTPCRITDHKGRNGQGVPVYEVEFPSGLVRQVYASELVVCHDGQVWHGGAP